MANCESGACAATLRLKLGVKGSNQIKMVTIQSTTTFRELKEAAASKLGFESASELEFFWDADCKVEEPDEASASSLFKDGDRIMVVSGDDGALAGSPRFAEGPNSKAGSACEYGTQVHLLPPMHRLSSQEPSYSNRGEDAEYKTTLSQEMDSGSPWDPLYSSQPGSSHRARGLQLSSDQEQDVGRNAPLQTVVIHQPPKQPSLPKYKPASQPSALGTASCKPHEDGSKKCTCRKNKCLKLYCQCFATGVFCNGCMCMDCSNNVENVIEVHLEMRRALLRNPAAFTSKVATKEDGEIEHTSGCRCRRSRCIKKYCECFDGGVRCSELCKCMDCENQQGGASDESAAAVSCHLTAVTAALSSLVEQPEDRLALYEEKRKSLLGSRRSFQDLSHHSRGSLPPLPSSAEPAHPTQDQKVVVHQLPCSNSADPTRMERAKPSPVVIPKLQSLSRQGSRSTSPFQPFDRASQDWGPASCKSSPQGLQADATANLRLLSQPIPGLPKSGTSAGYGAMGSLPLMEGSNHAPASHLGTAGCQPGDTPSASDLATTSIMMLPQQSNQQQDQAVLLHHLHLQRYFQLQLLHQLQRGQSQMTEQGAPRVSPTDFLPRFSSAEPSTAYVQVSMQQKDGSVIHVHVASDQGLGFRV